MYANTASGAVITNPNTGDTKTNLKIETKKDSIIVYYIFTELQIVVPLQFKISDTGFTCTILSSKIVENSVFKLLTVSLLPYFGSVKGEQDGYIFIPDGSGALAYFKDGKSSYSTYKAPVYGRDECLDILTDSNKVQTVRLPVFGLKRDNTGFLAIITKGEANSFVAASITGQDSSYSRVFTEFTIRSQDSYTMGEGKGSGSVQTVKVYEEKELKVSSDNETVYNLTDFVVDYQILATDENDYNGMARKYRQYLANKHKLEITKSEPSVHIELPGAIRVAKKLFGFDIYSTKSLNDSSDVENIICNLKEKDVDNIDIKYTSWTKQQIKNQIADKGKVLSTLGSKNDFEKIINKNKGTTDFYFETDFYETENIQLKYKLSNVFSYSASGKKALKYSYELENYLRSPYVPAKNLISPLKSVSLAERFVKSFKIDGAKTSIGKMSAFLSSDFRKQGYTRNESKNDIINALEVLSAKNKMMISGGNAYSLPFASIIIDAPESSSAFDFADISVPFYQLVLSGFVDYSYQPLNSNTDPSELFLKSIETGASLHFYFISQNSEYLPDTSEYSKFTSIKPDDWYNSIGDYYSRMCEIGKATEGSELVSHKVLTDSVTESTFGNGTRIIVNYSNNNYNHNDTVIEANGYKVISRGN